jgi:hypothetical protein
LTEDQSALLVELRNSGIEPPYSHAHVTETAIHREILRIYQLARPLTRQVYDLGRDTERVEEENWVIRWMLWHVFRYRDNRNRNRRGTSGGHSGDNDDDEHESLSRASTSKTSTPRMLLYLNPAAEHSLNISQIKRAATGILYGTAS